MFTDLRLSVDCWLIMNGSHEGMLDIRCCFIRLLRLAMGDSCSFLTKSGVYIAKCVWVYILGGSHSKVMKGST